MSGNIQEILNRIRLGEDSSFELKSLEFNGDAELLLTIYPAEKP